MSKEWLERVVIGFAAVVLGLAAWFWNRQIQDMLELLRMASGQ